MRRRERTAARLRRKRRRRAMRASSAGTLAVLLAVFAVVKGLPALGLDGGSGTTSGAHSKATASGHGANDGAPEPPRPTRSPTGLPLGRPPLHLDLGGEDEQVQAPFHHPPRAGLLFDLSTGRVLWRRNPLTRLPIASLTKMMTALLVVRSQSAGVQVPISKRAVDAQGSKVGLLPLHKHVRLETLLYGLLLPSGNDAAVALAEDVAGSVPDFVGRMNTEAAKLGLACTRFASPDGLQDANSSCAADLAELASVDLAQPRIARATRSASAVLPFPIKGGKLYLYNNNPLLRYGYPGATGLKTGETEAAGLCLVGTAERGGVRLGVVLLHSPELGRQAEFLLDRGFQAYGLQAVQAPPVPPGR